MQLSQGALRRTREPRSQQPHQQQPRHAKSVACSSLPEQAASLASRIQDPGAWRGLEPHFGSNAARGALEQAAAAVSNLQLPSGGGGAQLPSLPSLPQLPQLPAGPDLSKFEIGLPSKLPAAPSLSNVQLPSVQLPSLPAVQLPEALPDASALANAARGGAAAAADAVAHLPEALAAEVALLQQLLASAPAALSQAASRGAAAAGGAAGMGAGAGAGGLGGLEPHFGTRAAQALLSEFGAALGARGVVPPMMQLPTGAAALADGSLPLPGGGDPSALAAALAGAWSAAGGAAAALLPPQAAAALAAGAAAAAAQPAAAAAAAAERLGALSAAAEQLRAAAVALPEAGHAGVDFPTLCFAAAGALLATAASVPPASYEASASAPSTTGGNNSASGAGFDPRDPPLSHEYDPEAVAAYFRRRPVAVASRAAALAAEAAALGAALAGDFATGRVAANEKARSAQLRGAIERLGPAYVKVAQALSTRVDLLSPAYFEQIQLLQDRVPPFPCDEAKAAIAEALGRPVDEVFSRISPRPVAAASLGQVYRATLVPKLGGGEVAVKVQRPGVLEQVALDLYLMRSVAVALGRLPDVTTDWASLIDNWAVRFLHEMDYSREAANALTWQAQMAAAGVDGVTIARPVDALCTGTVLTTEWVDGEKLSESNASDVRALCSTLLNTYLIQLLDTGFLHADPHPGNLIRTNDGKICVLDFGLMTEVTPEQRVALVEYIAHLTTQDWPNVARDLQTLGFIPADAGDPATLGLVEPLGRILSQLSGGGGATKLNIDAVMGELEALGREYPFSIPPFFALILRAFSVIEGIALRVDPDYAIVMECFPYISRRLLSDDDPRMRQALRDVLYGGRQRLDLERLIRLADGFSAFTTDGLPDPASPGRPQRQLAAPQGQQPQQQQQAAQQQRPALDPAARDALVLVFSERNTYVQELIVEELAAAVDALSLSAVQQLLRTVLASAPAAAAAGRLRALGPLRPLLLPLPTPLELLGSIEPAVALSEEDEEALSVVRGVLQIAQRLQAAGAAPDGAWDVQGGAGDFGVQQQQGRVRAAGDAVASAARVAAEIQPLLPQIAPGLASTGDALLRALVKRAARRAAGAAGEISGAFVAAAAAASAGGGDARGGVAAPAPVPAVYSSFESPQRSSVAPAQALFASSHTNGVGAGVGVGGSGGGELLGPAAAGTLIAGLAAAPLMLALAPLALLGEAQRQQQQRRQQRRGGGM